MDYEGVKFYGIEDIGSYASLIKSEKIFEQWGERKESADINVIIELFNIKKCFNAGIVPSAWTVELIDEYKEKCKEIPCIIRKFCDHILSDDNIQKFYENADIEYKEDFWEIINDYKVYDKISEKAIYDIVVSNKITIWKILSHSKIVKKFDRVLTDCLEKNPYTVEMFVSYNLADHGANKIFWPQGLSIDKINALLFDYVCNENAKINVLKLIENAISTKEFPISDRLKLEARRNISKQIKEFIKRGMGTEYKVTVEFKLIPDGSDKKYYDNKYNTLYCEYDLNWITDNLDYPTLMNNFIYVFQFVDLCFRWNFVSLKSELSILEQYIETKGKKWYVTGMHFNSKNNLGLSQLVSYYTELERNNIHLESIIKWFFESYLKEEFNVKGFIFEEPSLKTTYLEKCKLIASSIDGILKQFRMFAEDGYIDRELFEISSGHVSFEKIGSLMNEKYAYAKSEALIKEMELLYSDRSFLHYTEKTRNKYTNLPKMLIKDNMHVEDFNIKQRSDLKWLIDKGTVYIDNGRLKINTDRAIVLKDLFYKEVICPNHYGPRLKEQVNKLSEDKEIYYENTLFSKPEKEYLNYYLNKAEFGNGFDLRNKYLHDTYPIDENIQKRNYFELLRILVLIVIKINEEFCYGTFMGSDIEKKDTYLAFAY